MTDIMIARHDQHRYRDLPHQLHGKSEIFILVRAVDGEVTGMDDDIRTARVDPTRQRFPISVEMRLVRAEMRVGDLDDFHAGGSFTEFYATDFRDDVILMGHDGPGHIAIAEGKIKVRPLRVYHGKIGRGLSALRQASR